MDANSWVRFMIGLASIAIIILFAIGNTFKKHRFFTTKNIAAIGVLTAIEITLQIIGNFITLGPVSINLCLIPIAIGAILYGPLAGAFLGAVNGVAVIFAPSTLAVFMPINPVATIIICLLKSTIAGFVSGLVFLLFKNKNETLGSILTSIILPIINTGLFAIGSLIFFRPFLDAVATNGFPNIFVALLLGVIGWNFIFELGTSTIVSPAISRIVKIIKKRAI